MEIGREQGVSEHGHWWAFGNYTGEDCSYCKRNRVVICEDPSGKERKICEKCSRDQDLGDFAPDTER